MPKAIKPKRLRILKEKSRARKPSAKKPLFDATKLQGKASRIGSGEISREFARQARAQGMVFGDLNRVGKIYKGMGLTRKQALAIETDKIIYNRRLLKPRMGEQRFTIQELKEIAEENVTRWYGK